MDARYLIILAGPTAVGKTALAIELAQHFNTGIINADSRQVYRELRIGTAVPSPQQLASAKHYLVAHRSIHEPYNASVFEREAMEILRELFISHNSVILTGGSGLYIDAVCHGIDDFPNVDTGVRERLFQEYKEKGLAGIRSMLLNSDSEYYYRADLNNPKRLLKALEIIEMTGKPYSSFLTGRAKSRKFEIIRISLDIPREDLHERINKRADDMIAAGLLNEARELYPYRHLNALNTLGYKELFDYFDDKCTLEESLEKVKGHTRQYARRQLTWFRRDKRYTWHSPRNKDAIIKHILKIMEEHGKTGD